MSDISAIVSAITGGANLLGNVFSGIVGANQNNEVIDKQIAAQKAENAATREHNLQLAKMQNQWNIDQWNRENKYNSPAAQMQRFQAAGLNPNLIYGQSNTSGQISGLMTSGAPATPIDMSALGSKKNGLASVFKAVGDAAMQIPMYREQVRGMKLDNDRKEGDNDFQNFLRNFGPDGGTLSDQWTKYKNSYAGQKYTQDVESAWYDLQQKHAAHASLDEESRVREVRAALNEKLWKQIEQFGDVMKINKDAAEAVLLSFVYSAYGIKYDSLLKRAEEVMNNAKFFEKLPEGLPAVVKFLRMIFK